MRRIHTIIALSVLLCSSASAAPGKLRPAPRSISLSRNLLVRPIQRAIGKRVTARSHKDGVHRERTAYYRFDKASGKLVLRLVSYAKTGADGTKIKSVHLRLPRDKRASYNQLGENSATLGAALKSAVKMLGSVDIKETTITKADGSAVKRSVIAFSDARTKTVTVTSPDGKKTSSSKTSRHKTPERRAADKHFMTRHYALGQMLKARRAEAGNR